MRIEKKGMKIMKEFDIAYEMNETGQLIPILAAPEEEEVSLGHFARMRDRYLRQNKNTYRMILKTKGQLRSHLAEIERAAEERMDLIIEQLQAQMGVTEELKQNDQMKWIGLMGNIRHQAKEAVLEELIYT